LVTLILIPFLGGFSLFSFCVSMVNRFLVS
jgi:hypothetical protein